MPFLWMLPGALRQYEQGYEDEYGDRRGSQRAAECKATFTNGLIQEIPDGRTERAGEDEAAQNSSTRDTLVHR